MRDSESDIESGYQIISECDIKKKDSTRMNVRIHSYKKNYMNKYTKTFICIKNYTNVCPNIHVSKVWHRRKNAKINIHIENCISIGIHSNIHPQTNIWIFNYSKILDRIRSQIGSRLLYDHFWTEQHLSLYKQTTYLGKIEPISS